MMQPTHTLNWPISSRLILLKLRDTRNCSRWSQRTHSTDPATTDTDTLNRLCFNQRTHSTDSLCSPADTLKSADPAASQRTYSTDPTKLQSNGRLNRCIRRTHSTHPVSCANQCQPTDTLNWCRCAGLSVSNGCRERRAEEKRSPIGVFLLLLFSSGSLCFSQTFSVRTPESDTSSLSPALLFFTSKRLGFYIDFEARFTPSMIDFTSNVFLYFFMLSPNDWFPRFLISVSVR